MRWKRWLKRVVAVVVLSLLVRTVWLVGQREWRRAEGDREFAAAVAETEATDPNWQWDRLNAARKRPPDGQNSADLIPKIKAALPADWDKRSQARVASNTSDMAANVRHATRWHTEVQSDLDTVAGALRLAHSLKDLPEGFRAITLAHNPLETLLADTQHTRDVAYLLMLDAADAAEDGDPVRLADDLAAALNVSRSIGDEPILISQLVRIATRSVMLRSLERALAQTKHLTDLNALRLPLLQDALARDLEEPLFYYGVRGERAMFDILIQHLYDGTLDLSHVSGEKHGLSTDARLGWWLYRGRLSGDRAFVLRWFNVAVTAAKKPIHEQAAALEQLPPLTDKQNLMARLIPAADKVAAAGWRSVAEGRCAVVGIACERFRLKQGRWPETLAELCPEFLPAVPLDPYDGQPLRYTKVENGVIVHSVGTRPTATRPGLPEGIHIGFRLWNPDQRRLPPPPEVAPLPREVGDNGNP